MKEFLINKVKLDEENIIDIVTRTFIIEFKICDTIK